MKRKVIPRKTQRQLLVESGYMCSMPHCYNNSALDFHHIDGNPANDSPDNLIVFCSNHHRLATLGKIDSLACKEMKKALKPEALTFNVNPDILKNMRRVMRQELQKVSLNGKREKTQQIKHPSLFQRKVLFDFLGGDLPNMLLAVAVLGELRISGGVPKIIKAMTGLRRGIRPRGKPLPLSLAARVYQMGIWALYRYGTRTAIEWLAGQLLKTPREPVLIFELLSALKSSKKAKQYVGFQILKISSGGKEKFLEITYTLYDRHYRMRIEVIRSTKKKRKLH